ncbi:MAG: radical SAM family heme chaperone HemW [Deltaproteobacteria bacterium]|nr:radical SAM family heme chaperone HemW [Deltaproteobacteria bacterium]
MENNQAGLYIHIPFCLSKCGYCSFYSIASTRHIPEFVKTVRDEMSAYKKAFRSFDTIYIGGGTPSLLAVEQLNEILDAARQVFEIDRQAEVTMEVNPGDVSFAYFQSLRSLGVNRLNIGVQSFDEHILTLLGRRHSVKEALSALDAARSAGFDNIGIDLIYGVRGQDIDLWRRTLKNAVSLSPEHLSCYQLSLDQKTPLYRQYQQQGFKLPSEDEALDFFMTTSQTLTDSGYIHYEVSNFARSASLKSRHNMKYWRHTPYLGLGPAAHSFLGRRRWWNRADITAYLKDLAGGVKPVEQSEELTREQLALEALFLGLRTKEGIGLAQYKDDYGLDLLSDKRQAIDELQRNRLAELKDGRLCPTLAGMAVADSLALI